MLGRWTVSFNVYTETRVELPLLLGKKYYICMVKLLRPPPHNGKFLGPYEYTNINKTHHTHFYRKLKLNKYNGMVAHHIHIFDHTDKKQDWFMLRHIKTLKCATNTPDTSGPLNHRWNIHQCSGAISFCGVFSPVSVSSVQETPIIVSIFSS